VACAAWIVVAQVPRAALCLTTAVSRRYSTEPQSITVASEELRAAEDRDFAIGRMVRTEDGRSVVSNWTIPRIPGVLESAESQADTLGVTPNVEGDTQAMATVAVFSVLGVLLLLLLFTALRHVAPTVYTRFACQDVCGQHRPFSLLSLCPEWILLVLSTTPDEEVNSAGLDGWALLEAYRLFRRIFSLVGVIVLGILLPIHLSGSGWFETRDFVSRLDISHMPKNNSCRWLHAVLVVFVIGVITSFVRASHEEFVERRFHWLQNLQNPQRKTVLIENIPPQYRSDRALREYFERIFSKGSVERAYLVRKTDRLCGQMEQLKALSCKLSLSESGEAGCEASCKGLDATREQRRRLIEAIKEERARIEAACSGELEDSQAEADLWRFRSASGFVTFASRLQQRMASRELYRKDITEFIVERAPSPSDVVYNDLARSHTAAGARERLGWFCLVFLFVTWCPMVVCISSSTKLDKLQHYFEPLRELCTRYPQVQWILEGILATAALKLFLAFLPNILLGIIQKFFLLKADSWAQVRLERWYFAFLIIFVLLVTILGRSIVFTALMLIEHPTKIMELLAASLPGVSHFYINYVQLGIVAIAFEAVRIANLVKYGIHKVVYNLPREAAKHLSEPEDPASFGIGARMALTMLMAAISIVFCTCSPLIVIPAWGFFALGELIYGYLLVYAETKKPDLGGCCWVEAVEQVFFAMLIFVLLMTRILIKQPSELPVPSYTQAYGPSLVAFSTVFLMHWQRTHIKDLAWENLPLQVLVQDDARHSQLVHSLRSDTVACSGEEYVQQECITPLD